MQIFNVKIFGSDAEWFISLDCEVKKQWILDNTNQKNEDLIDEFIKNARLNKEEECSGCKEKAKHNANISKSISTETTTDVIDSNTSGNSGGGNTKRRKRNQGT